MSGVEIRGIDASEVRACFRAFMAAMGDIPSDERVELAAERFEVDRQLVADDRGRIVGTAGAFTFSLTVPGGVTVPCAGVTQVGVLPTHRRQGVLTSLMRRQLEGVRERGDPVAMLGASEAVIYGRFGYGLATSHAAVELSRPHAALAHAAPSDGAVRLVDLDEARRLLPHVYERLRSARAGSLTRPEWWWDRQVRGAPGAAGARFAVVWRAGDGADVSYALYRMSRPPGGNDDGVLEIDELIAVTPAGHAALWRYLVGVDLVDAIRWDTAPLDDPLRWMLADPRRLHTTSVPDGKWLRVVDVAGALAARRYAVADRLVLDVADPFMLEWGGRFALDGAPDGASCSPTSAAAEIALSAADLGAVYLGGVEFSTLARAGRVRELTPGALRRADAMFRAQPIPWCSTWF